MSAHIFILLFTSTIYIQTEARLGGYGCPGASLAFNSGNTCSCSNVWVAADYAYKTVVNCAGYAGSASDFAKVLQSLDNFEIDDLVINGYRSVRLPDDVLSKTIVRRIIILNSLILEDFGFKDSGNSFFQNLGNTLETLIIYYVPNIRSEQWKLMSDSLASAGAPYLKNLILCVSSIPIEIDLNDFSSLTGLEKITMRNMGITALTENSDFSKFPNLRLLDLSENRLTTFAPVALPTRLTTIYLFTNVNLQGFNKVLFDSMDTIDYINVKNPNNLDCLCDTIGQIVGTAAADKFDGNCATPPQMRGKKYGPECWDPATKTIISTKFNSSSILRKTRFIRTNIN